MHLINSKNKNTYYHHFRDFRGLSCFENFFGKFLALENYTEESMYFQSMHGLKYREIKLIFYFSIQSCYRKRIGNSLTILNILTWHRSIREGETIKWPITKNEASTTVLFRELTNSRTSKSIYFTRKEMST